MIRRSSSTRWHSRKGEDNNDDDFIATLAETVGSIFSRPLLVGSLDPPLALGYPIVILASILILPIVTSVLLVVCFCLYTWFGRAVVLSDWEDDEEERPPVDLLALGAAVVTARLLTPLSVGGGAATVTTLPGRMILLVPATSSPSWLIQGVVFITLIATLVLVASKGDDGGGLQVGPAETTTTYSSEASLEVHDKDLQIDNVASTNNERKLMDLWDESLKSQSTSTKVENQQDRNSETII